jgi:hypothetical protein
MQEFFRYSHRQADIIVDEAEFFPDLVDYGQGVAELVLMDYLDNDTFCHGWDQVSIEPEFQTYRFYADGIFRTTI